MSQITEEELKETEKAWFWEDFWFYTRMTIVALLVILEIIVIVIAANK